MSLGQDGAQSTSCRKLLGSASPRTLGFRPDPARVSPEPVPEPLGFRPDPARVGSEPVPDPLRFRPDLEGCSASSSSSPNRDATIYSLPLATLVCKTLREEDTEGSFESDLVLDDLRFHVEPGGVRRAEERLDQMVVELKKAV